MTKKNILFCSERLGLAAMGGGLAAGYDLLALLATGHDLYVLSRDMVDVPNVYEGMRLKKPRWLSMEIPVPHPPEFSFAYLYAQMLLITQTRRIRSVRPDLIIVQGVEGHRLLERFRSWDGIPKLIAIQGSPDIFRGIYHNGVDQLPRALMEIATYDAMVQFGPIMAATWEREPMLKGTSVHILYNTIDEPAAAKIAAEDKTAIRTALGVPDDVFMLSCVASVQRRKGQDLLLDAVVEIMGKMPSLNLYLVGPVVLEWGGREIMRQLSLHAFKDRIHLVGSVSNQESLRWLRASDCFVLPTREEAMPVSILEAMYLGTPVIASDVNGIPDEIKNENCGLLFSHENPHGLTECIERMVSDDTFRDHCAVQARMRYDQVFTNKHHMRRWADIVHNYLAG